MRDGSWIRRMLECDQLTHRERSSPSRRMEEGRGKAKVIIVMRPDDFIRFSIILARYFSRLFAN